MTLSFSRIGLRWIGSLALLTALGVALPATAQAQQDGAEETPAETPADQPTETSVPEFNDAMKQMAAEVAKFLEQEGQTAIEVGSFTGPPTTSGGPGIVQGIKENLPKEIDTSPQPDSLNLSGKYRLTQDKNSGKHCIVIEATVNDSFGNPLHNITRYILTDEQSVQTLMGGNGTLPTKAPPGETLAEARDAALVKNIKKPDVVIESGPAAGPSSIIRLPDSPFGVEIMVQGPGGKYAPIPARNQKGLPFVDLQKNQIYAVRLINDSDQPVGAAVSIDGINTLAFSQSPGFKQVGKWVVGPKNPGALVKGWHKFARTSSSFRVTDYGDSVAGRAGIVGPAIGTISVQFFAAFTDAPPKDEPRGELVQRGDLATGEGPPVEQNAKPVFMKFGVSRGQVSIRYTREFADDLPADAPPPQ